MIDRHAATRLAMRFSGIPGFPQTSDGQDELIAMIANRIFDAAHGEKFRTAVLEDCEFCPSPKQVADIARATAPEEAKPQVGCAKCGFTGFVETRVSLNGRSAPAQAFCSCRPVPILD
jgi:hypothetical protein